MKFYVSHISLLVLIFCRCLQASDSNELRQELMSQNMAIRSLEKQVQYLQRDLQGANQTIHELGKVAQNDDSSRLEERLMELEESQELQAEEMEALENSQDLQIKFNGYFDLKSVDYKTKENLHKDSFDQHHTALFMDLRKGNAQFFAEMEWEHSGKNLKQERAWVRYRTKQGLVLKGGHFFSPTHWNLNHYPTIALSVNDPDFNRRFFPRSLTGLSLSKSWLRGHSSLTYEIYSGNGFDEDPALVGRDFNGSKAVGQRVKFERDRGHFSYGLTAHHYRDRRMSDLLGTAITSDGKYVSSMLEGELKYGRFQMLGSALEASFREPARARGKIESKAWYLQPAWALSNKFTTYARVGRMDPDESAITNLDRKQQIYGLNYKPTPSTTVKLEWLENTHRLINVGDDRELWSSLSFAF